MNSIKLITILAATAALAACGGGGGGSAAPATQASTAPALATPTPVTAPVQEVVAPAPAASAPVVVPVVEVAPTPALEPEKVVLYVVNNTGVFTDYVSGLPLGQNQESTYRATVSAPACPYKLYIEASYNITAGYYLYHTQVLSTVYFSYNIDGVTADNATDRVKVSLDAASKVGSLSWVLPGGNARKISIGQFSYWPVNVDLAARDYRADVTVKVTCGE